MSRYVVGIDLGTTNCAVGYVDTSRADEDARIEIFQIPQVVATGEVKARDTLPSFMYLASPSEFAKGALALPWDKRASEVVVGEFARNHGWQTPSRLVSSAKSWLCHPGIDRSQPCLPWQAPAEVNKVSPVAASARYLAHIRAAWDAAFEDHPLAEQEVLITVPASFDAVARELTVHAATAAGLENVTLLEEPQAAFYSWLATAGDAWRKTLKVGDVVLVCDVGGGTTDFSLIAVNEDGGNLVLERIAVGDHILLGGDNMDLTLAYLLRGRLTAEGSELDDWQFASLVHACRAAKETLLSDKKLKSAPVTVLGRGSKVIGGSLRTELLRADVETTLLDGFFPACALTDKPKAAPRVGLRELGLPYAADPGITRHLAAFLAAHKQATRVLFNGGVMKSPVLAERVRSVLGDLAVLEGTDLDVAVAHGAAYYGMVRRGRGVRIRGGTARAYYIGIESSMPAVPGLPAQLKALCVAPCGMEEGTEADVAGGELGLVVGEPAEFRFLSSSVRKDDVVGTLVERVDDRIAEHAPMSAALGDKDAKAGEVVPVRLRSRLTEIGTLELWCVAQKGDRRWKLEYNLRD